MTELSKILHRLSALGEELDQHGGLNIQVIDVSGRYPFFDYFVVAGADSDTGVSPLTVTSEKWVRDSQDFTLNGVEGSGTDWVILDLGSVLVHILKDEAREFYSIERQLADCQCWQLLYGELHRM